MVVRVRLCKILEFMVRWFDLFLLEENFCKFCRVVKLFDIYYKRFFFLKFSVRVKSRDIKSS